jgi:hypothetical protein
MERMGESTGLRSANLWVTLGKSRQDWLELGAKNTKSEGLLVSKIALGKKDIVGLTLRRNVFEVSLLAECGNIRSRYHGYTPDTFRRRCSIA